MRKVLIVLLVVLVGGVIAADRIGVQVAQNEIAKQVAAQYSLPNRPVVTIHGFPFITQAVGGRYDEIEVGIGDWTQQDVTVHDLKIKLSGLTAPLGDVIRGNTSSIVADTATASAVVPFEAIQRRAPQGVTKIANNGNDLQLEGTFSAYGFTVPMTVVVSVKATPDGIAVTPHSVRSATGPTIPTTILQAKLTFVIPVRNLPIGSRISEVAVTPGGLRVAATANNVKFGSLPRV